MKSIVILITIIIIYYQINRRYPTKLTKKNHLYFISFCIIYSLIIYLTKYQKIFVYKVLKNIKEADEKPLFDVNSMIYKETKMEGLKNHLAMRQGWRCISCQNPILQKDIYLSSISYIKPLQLGGENDITNLGIVCHSCSNFIQY